MARMIDDGGMGASPFPRNTALDSMTEFNQGMQHLLPMIAQYKQLKLEKQPLGEYLGATKPEDLPESLRPLYNTPIRKIAGLQNALGGSLGSILKPQQPTVPLFFNPSAQQGQNPFSMTPGQGLIPVPGAKPAQAVSALKPSTSANQLGPDKISSIADRVQGGDYKMLMALPSFGANSPRNQVMAELAHRGVNVSNLDLDYQAKLAYTKTINSPGFQNTLKYLRSVGPNMDTLIQLSDKIGRTFAKPINRAQLAIMANGGDKDAAAFGAAAIEVSDQVAKILQGGGTGSGTSDVKLKQAQDVLNGSFTPVQLKSIAGMLKGLLNERETALKSDTMLTFNGSPKAKVAPEQRFQTLLKSGKKEDEVYKIMAQEGY